MKSQPRKMNRLERKEICFEEKEVEVYFEVVWDVIEMYQK